MITGGTGGLGKGIATMFLSAGADVTVLGLHPEKMAAFDSIEESLRQHLFFIKCDITDAADVDAMLDEIEKNRAMAGTYSGLAAMMTIPLTEFYSLIFMHSIVSPVKLDVVS